MFNSGYKSQSCIGNLRFRNQSNISKGQMNQNKETKSLISSWSLAIFILRVWWIGGAYRGILLGGTLGRMVALLLLLGRLPWQLLAWIRRGICREGGLWHLLLWYGWRGDAGFMTFRLHELRSFVKKLVEVFWGPWFRCRLHGFVLRFIFI